MTDPIAERDELEAALRLAADEARRYLAGLANARVMPEGAEAGLRGWDEPLPERGEGTLAALAELAEGPGPRPRARAGHASFTSSWAVARRPRCADWLTSVYDQSAFAFASSPFAARLEQVSLAWLRQLFELPEEMGGVPTSGATMANFVALAAARNWWAQKLGVDVERGAGRAAQPVVPERLSIRAWCRRWACWDSDAATSSGWRVTRSDASTWMLSCEG